MDRAVRFVYYPGLGVDDCVALAERDDVIFTTFGDAMPRAWLKSLLQAKADGAQVKMVYSPLKRSGTCQAKSGQRSDIFALGLRLRCPAPL